MCIIIAKQKGKAYNKQELIKAIKTAKIHNKHGAGFALKKADNPNQIILSKGYMFYYDIMLDRLDKENIQEEDELMIHLRYSTGGYINKANCHPYIVSDDIDEVKEDEMLTEKPVLSHNGTFWEHQYQNDINSDTVNFILEYASVPGVLDNLKFLKEVDSIKASNILGMNRICTLFPGEGEDMLIMGSWNKMEEDGDFIYSNFYHTHTTPAKAYGGKSPHTVKA